MANKEKQITFNAVKKSGGYGDYVDYEVRIDGIICGTGDTLEDAILDFNNFYVSDIFDK